MHYSILLTYIKSKDYWQQLNSSLPVESSLFCPIPFALLVFQTHMISVLQMYQVLFNSLHLSLTLKYLVELCYYMIDTNKRGIDL